MTYDLGKICPRLRGTYSSSATYDILDVVYYNGASYICKADDTKNKVPTNTTYWQPMAAAGETQTSLTPAQINTIVAAILQEGVVVDSEYSTFKNDTNQAIQNYTAPGNGKLTLKRNGTNLGNFFANQGSDTVIDINVPVKIAQMQDYQSFLALIQNGWVVVKLTKGDETFEKVDLATTYVFDEPISELTINNLVGFEEACTQLPSRIHFTAETDFTPVIPACYLHDCSDFSEGGKNTFTAGNHYEIEINGDHVIFRLYNSVDPSNNE